MAQATILIIDDNRDRRENLKTLLEWAGYQVHDVPGAHPLRSISRTGPDIILLSMGLKEEDPMEVLERLGQKEPVPPLLVLSGPQRPSVAVKALKLGAADFIEGPLNPKVLLKAIRTSLKPSTTTETSRALRNLGRYEVRGILSRGGMGKVYEGWDPDLCRAVAIKALTLSLISSKAARRELEARFMREATLYGALSHPNIVPLYDFGKSERSKVLYLVMALMDGPTLRQVLDRRGSLLTWRALDITLQIQRALSYAHRQGVIHRDVKPGNILMARDGRACLTDFGVARIEGSTITAQNIVLGTVPYLSPEQLQGHPVDGRSDQFSLGVVSFECLTGEHPFGGKEGESVEQIAKRILTMKPRNLLSIRSDLSRDVANLLERMLAKAPQDRFQQEDELEMSIKTVSHKIALGW